MRTKIWNFCANFFCGYGSPIIIPLFNPPPQPKKLSYFFWRGWGRVSLSYEVSNLKKMFCRIFHYGYTRTLTWEYTFRSVLRNRVLANFSIFCERKWKQCGISLKILTISRKIAKISKNLTFVSFYFFCFQYQIFKSVDCRFK